MVVGEVASSPQSGTKEPLQQKGAACTAPPPAGMPDFQSAQLFRTFTCGRFMLFRTAGKLECPVQPGKQSAHRLSRKDV